MRDQGRIKEHYDFSFDSRQLGLVLFAALVVAALLFVLGISVGRQWERKLSAKSRTQAEPPVAMAESAPEAVLPAAPPVKPSPVEKDAEDESAEPSRKAVPEVPEEKPAKEAIAPENLTFPKVLTSGKAAPAVPAPSKKAPAAKTAVNGKFTVQVAAFKDRAAAEGLAGKLRKKGYDAGVHVTNSSGGSVCRVHVGGYSSRDKAQKMVETLRSKEGFKPYVTTY